MTRRRLALSVLAFFAVVACAVAGVGGSGANFTAASSNGAQFTTGDWTAPAVTLTAPAANARVGSRTPTFMGAAGTDPGDLATITVRIYSGASTGGTQAQALTAAAASGTWSATPVIDLPDGTYTAQAEQADAAGHLGKSAAVTFTIDATAPAPTVTSPTGAVQVPVFTGAAGTATGDGAVTVTVTKSGGSPVPYTASVSGAIWTATVPTLAEGDYTVTASQSDDLGKTGTSPAQSFSVDRTAPAVILTSPATGLSTNASTPVFSGARGVTTGDDAAVTLNIYAGSTPTGTPVQTRTATVSGGTWSATAAAGLVDGTYTAQAVQVDAAGNTGKSSATTFTLDTIAPSPTITAPSGYTSPTPVLSGTAGNATGDAGTVKVEILSAGSPVQTLTPTRTATTWSVRAVTLAQGSYTAQVTQSDAAGNASTSAATSFTVDTAGPAVTVTSPVAGSATSNVTPTVSGAAGTAAGDLAPITVVITNTATSATQTRTTNAGGGTWSVAATTLVNGSYTVTASQSDAAGNTTTTTAVSFTVDTVAPAAPTVTAPSGYVTTKTPTIIGTAANGSGDNAAVTVEILSSGTVVQTLSAPRTGTAWSVTAPSLAEGPYTVRARQGDSAGNTSATSAAVAFTVDSIAPAVTLTAPAANAYLRTTTPTFSGATGTAAGDVASVTVTIRTSGGALVQTRPATVTGATWSVAASPALGQGTYTVTATQSDAATNVATTPAVTFTVDTTAPTATSISAGGGTVGRIESGDVVTFTYSEAIAPASVLAGFTGTATPVRVRIANGGKDVMTILDGAGAATVRLATQVTLSANFVTSTTTWAATMTQSADQKSFVITLGAPDLTGTTKTVGASKNMTWTFPSAATDLAGNAIAAGSYTETVADTDF